MKLQLAALFQNHAVFQRDQHLPVWGSARPNTAVRVTLDSHVACTFSNPQGDFLVRLPPLPAGGPHTLCVDTAETGEHLEVQDILIGEVWLASGQSNMEWTLAKSRPLTETDISSADYPALRFFTVPCRANLGPQRSVAGDWKISTPQTAGDFSAVAFSFARRLHRELGIPVGVISSSWGGSFIQAWMSRSALALNPETKDWLSSYEDQVWSESRMQQMLAPDSDGRVSNMPKDPGNTGITQHWHQPDFEDSGWNTMTLPATWQSAGHVNSGVYWFRRSVEIPSAWIGCELKLHLGAIDKQDTTYVNGIEVGRTGKGREDQHWNVPRIYSIPASAVTSNHLQIAVRAYSFVYHGGLIGPADMMRLQPVNNPDSSCSIAGVWTYHCEHDLGLVTESHVMGHGERNSPHILFDNMIQPLIPYALRGAIWYQGEGNAGTPDIYTGLQRNLIQDWQRQWGLPDFAFHLVQLPGFQSPQAHQPDSLWARLRETQTTALALPHVGMAVTIDLGEADDIHPKNKIPVGERLAQSALSVTYGHDLVACGPIVQKFVWEDSSIRCHFRHIGKGLVTSDGASPGPFFVAGEDRVFHPAEACIEESTVLVRCSAVSRPVAVRYAWADNPEGCNLANRDGLPASPFRSDKW